MLFLSYLASMQRIAAGLALPGRLGHWPGAAAFRAWMEAEQGRFVLWLPVALAAGVVAYFALRAEPSPWWGGLVLLGVLAPMAGWPPWLRAAAALVAAVSLGFAAAQLATWRAAPMPDIPSRATIVTATIAAVEQLLNGRRLTLASPQFDGAAPIARAVRVRLKASDAVDLSVGDRVRVRALLMRPAPPAFPGAWDLQRDAWFANLAAFGYALNAAERLEGERVGGHWLRGVREAVEGRIRAVLPGPDGAIAATLLTGLTSAIPEADRAAYRDSGLAHLLAIAGLHIGIVMGLVFATTRYGLALSERVALACNLRQVAALAAIAGGGAYLLFTGAHVPIQRSFAMACLVTLGVLVGRRAVSLRGLALAMAVVTLASPSEVMGVSFQMSFSAVLALIVGYAALRPWLARLHGRSIGRRIGSHVVALALTSALAGTFSAPYAAYHFGHIQLYYVAANMLAVPLTAFWVMPAGMIALLLMPVHLEALALVPMGWGIEAITAIGRFVSAWPAAVLAVPPMPGWGLAVLSLGLAWAGLWRTRLRWLGVPLVALGVLSPLLLRPADILVSADARLIGLRTAAGVVLQRNSGAADFTRDAWLQYWTEADAIAFPESGEAAGGAVSCDPAACALRAGGGGATLVRAPAGITCATALLIAAEPLRVDCVAPPPRIDRFSVWREGAYAVWLNPDGPVLLSDRQARGDRPWVLPVPTRSAMPKGVSLTPALAE